MKEAKTYEELAQKLKNMNINMYSIDTTVNHIKNYGYFDLYNNYKKEIKKHLLHSSLAIEDVVILRDIDNDIQSIIFKYILFIESVLKNRLSYLISHSFGIEESQYKDINNYKNHISAKIFFKDIKNKKHINFNKYPAKHFTTKHQNIPPWIYLKHISFGDTKNFFSNLETLDKIKIIDDILPEKYMSSTSINSDKIKVFTQSLNVIHSFRNSIAHGGRLINFISDKTLDINVFSPLIPKSILAKNNFNKSSNFFTLLICILILTDNNRTKIRFIDEIDSVLAFYLNESNNNSIDLFHEVSNTPKDLISKLQDYYIYIK